MYRVLLYALVNQLTSQLNDEINKENLFLLKEDENILINNAQKMGINLHKEQIKKFSQYLELLIQWNQKINLTFFKKRPRK